MAGALNRGRTGAVAALAAMLAIAASGGEASAAIPPSLTDAASCKTITPAPGHSFVRCDDGVPSLGAAAPGPGGAIPNPTGAQAVTVPAKYDGFAGLPAKAADAAGVPGSSGGDVALDVDVSFPAASRADDHPIVFFMHGCCGGNKTSWQADSFDAGGERWHYSDAWFAARGYVVVTYTARGFVDNQEKGSTGETQLDSRDYEINDYQSLACQVTQLFNASGSLPDIDPQRVVTTGGSYGGGFSWLTVTDPRWSCANAGAPDISMRLAASAPKYGWTDLVYTLVPTGLHFQTPNRLPATNGCDTGPRQRDGSACPEPRTPVGTAKRSIVAGLYATGNLQATSHTTFPESIHEAVACLNGPYPYDSSPLCANVIDETLPEFLSDRSAYYQQEFFDAVAADPSARVPIFNAATFTDPLFPAVENRRMHNRLLTAARGYPLKAYFGDYQHFTSNKAKVWGDICGPDRHVCTNADYQDGFDRDPTGLVKRGVTGMLTRFLDHYARPRANADEPAPSFEVTAELQVCANEALPAAGPRDESGARFTADTFEELAPNELVIELEGTQTTTSNAEPNPHALRSDPVVNDRTNQNRCVVEDSRLGSGVASYTSEPLTAAATMIGATRVRVDFAPSTAPGLQLNARLYDVLPDGRAIQVDRGTRVLLPAEAADGSVVYELQGNGWRFAPGHRIRIELAQDDDPYVHASDVPSSLSLSRVQLRMPTRQADATLGGGGGACSVRMSGGRRDDRLRGTSAGDRIRGRRGDDRLRGLAGRDCLAGGAGMDRLHGGKAGDRLNGGRGRDRLTGGKGGDVLRGGKARDLLISRGGGRDVVRCGPGRDRVRADRRDRVRGCELRD